MKKETLKYLIPLIAIVIIIESVVLVTGMDERKQKLSQMDNLKTSDLSAGPEEIQQADAFMINVETDNKIMSINKIAPVEVKLESKGHYALDALNIYIKYDPDALDISNLTFDSKLPKPTFSKVSTTKGMLVVNFLISEPTGLNIVEGETISLLKFDAKPVKTGSFDFEISTGTDSLESATMFVENASSKALPYSSNKLTINVSK